jgi:hypothetical protein
MLGTLHISINSNSKSLITASVPVRILTVDKGGKFWTEEEDVYSAERSNLIEMFHHV